MNQNMINIEQIVSNASLCFTLGQIKLFFVKSHVVNILGFVDYMVSVAIAQMFTSITAAINNM